MRRALYLLHRESTQVVIFVGRFVRFKLFCVFVQSQNRFLSHLFNRTKKGNFGILSELVAEIWFVLETRIDSFVGLQSGNENVKYP
jgi:hypothetical protein